MNSIRYTASGRLGFWDTLPNSIDSFLKPLKDILVANSHAVMEAEQEFYESNDPTVASITAICDKIITRGNPALVDLDFERALLADPVQQFFRCEELEDSPEVGIRFVKSMLPNNSNALLLAADDLFCLPYRSGDAISVSPLPLELQNLTSTEENRFYEELGTAIGAANRHRIRRQVLISDLVDLPDNTLSDNLANNRVDFALQIGRLKWIFEVDGQQHEEPGQKEKDRKRDRILRENGWTVHRITTATIHSKLQEWLTQLKHRADKNETQALEVASNLRSVQDIIATSPMHAAAFYTILIPLAVHRCLRCLLKLYFHEILSTQQPQRILVVEEDLPITAEAFRMLIALWSKIHILAPEIPPPPEIELDIIGDNVLPVIPCPGLETRYMSAPDGSYDLILLNSFFLDEGCIGVSERLLFPSLPSNAIRIRRAVGFRTERELQWCESLRYDLADLANSLNDQNGVDLPSVTELQQVALQFLLQLIFRKRDFRDGQLFAISRLLQGQPTIALLPTGGGKSLIYQFSGMLLPGMTVIIDPIISLMVDQVANLRRSGIDLIGEVSSQQSHGDRETVLRNMTAGNLAFVFIAPERLQSEDFRNRLRGVTGKFPISLAVVDEAHCVSEWGHDFRPSYLHLPLNLRKYCSDARGLSPTLVALTGTASFAVLTDIQMEMGITDESAIVLPKSFDRAELQFEVESVMRREKSVALTRYRERLPRSLRLNPQNFYRPQGSETNGGLVFCPHVNGDLGIDSVAKQLSHNNIYGGTKPKNFTGNWDDHKQKIQNDFTDNRVQELVTTKSFGMGIDKPNIRYTIHYAMPESVEAFYQEAGRAGRNGQADYARCAILYSDDNWHAALEILNEPDHQRALTNLNRVGRDNQGDLFLHLWFLLNSYKGREQEKKDTVQLWTSELAKKIKELPVGSINTALLKFGKDNEREKSERAIFRLALLGLVEDYTVDWQSRQFEVHIRRITPSNIKENLRQYLMKYKFAEFADDAIRAVLTDTVENALRSAVNSLIDFVYDEIVAKRKQAIRTMGELCRSFSSDTDFREAILAYLQESEFTDELRGWVGRQFDEIGLDNINKLLNLVSSLEEVKRLIGTTRRMLDTDPQNVALRYLSVCTRLRSSTESAASVLDEADTLTRLIHESGESIRDPYGILVAMLEDANTLRDTVAEKIADSMLRQCGTLTMARYLLRSKVADWSVVRCHSLTLLMANVLRAAEDSGFYTALTQEYDNG